MTNGMAMDRRELLQRALVLAGVAVLPGGAQALAAAAQGAQRQLEPARFALLSALADTIVPKTDTPGALDAKVPENLDALLGTWASPQHKAEIVGALDELDRLAREKHQRGFVALTPAERAAVLAPHDAAALKAAPKPPPAIDPKTGKPKQDTVQTFADRMSPRFINPGYGKLKELVVVLFYYSEVALTHDLAYEHSPGEWLPSIPITPATRPWGGVGGL